jgi:putative transposase
VKNSRILLYRVIFVTYNPILEWCQKFGQGYANKIRRQRSLPGNKWHLDTVELKIKGQKYYTQI